MPIIQRLISVYKLWHEYVLHFPKDTRYTLGNKIDSLFIEATESIFIAGFLSREQKLPFVKKAASKLDLLNFFLQISWEVKSLDDKKYIAISQPLTDIGKMLGGWLRQLQTTTTSTKTNPAINSGLRE